MNEENIKIIKETQNIQKDVNQLLISFNEIFKDRKEKGDKHFMCIICTDNVCCIQSVASGLGQLLLSKQIINKLNEILNDI